MHNISGGIRWAVSEKVQCGENGKGIGIQWDKIAQRGSTMIPESSLTLKKEEFVTTTFLKEETSVEALQQQLKQFLSN